jgi:hypothetical protein
MGQQSLSGFLGLHIDIDKVFADNEKRTGLRKYGCVLINQGDKLTPERKIELVRINNLKYGLQADYINHLALPAGCDVKVYQLDKIISARKKFTTVE